MSMRAPSGLRGFAERSRDVMLASALVGVVTGLLLAGLERLTVDLLDAVRDLPDWLVVVVPGVGLVLAALTLRYLGRRTSPGLADVWLKAFHAPERDMDTAAAPGGVLASMLTIGFGGAMGLEGLSIFAGGSIGTWVQRKMGWLFRPVDSKVLMTAGAAAGVAAIFKAPATGALFAIEVPFQDDFARRKLLPCLVAAATGYLGFAMINGTTPLFAAHGGNGFDAVHLVGALAVGVVAGLGARVFSMLLRFAKGLTTRVSLPRRIAGATVAFALLIVISLAATGRNLMLGPGYDCIAWATKPDRARAAATARPRPAMSRHRGHHGRWRRRRSLHPARRRRRAGRSRRRRHRRDASTTRCSSSSASPRSSAPDTASRSRR